MQYEEGYRIRTWRSGEVVLEEDLFDMSEEEALTEYRATVRDQAKGTRVTLVRVMTVTVASSSK